MQCKRWVKLQSNDRFVNLNLSIVLHYGKNDSTHNLSIDHVCQNKPKANCAITKNQEITMQ